MKALFCLAPARRFAGVGVAFLAISAAQPAFLAPALVFLVLAGVHRWRGQ